ncbi:MAG: phosphoenolpyruvate-protein phosphotransferase PtsP, partial [Pseudomonas formosensis]|nr:phosphoenolpyruvate-protein phosphotransferase PtsP [Halopseudomonas formosensis]
LQLIARACREAGKPMSVCGEMAGDPAAAVLLLALGCDVLSMSASSLPRVKWLLRQISLDDARALLRDALREDNAYLVQSMLHLSLRNMGLGKVLQPLR